MREHYVEIIGGVIAALMVVVIIILNMNIDHQAPEILFESDVKYIEGDDINNLLQGVSAKDDCDGDVTERLMIDSLIVMEGNEFAKVTYLAKDSSNNIARKSRIVAYSGSGKNIYASYANSGDGMVSYVEEENFIESGREESIEVPETTGEEIDSTTEVENETTAEDGTTTEETTEVETTQANPKSPVLELAQNSCTIKQGTRFNVSTYVKSIVDDEDNRETLYRRIGIEGQYDTNTPGEYTFKVYCIDSDRNLSNKETFTLRVEE
ncbi:MAG: hypothetical protein ACI4AQ_02365 [Lachnospiraceae bacterium]